MQVSTHGRASFPTQANALLRKSICYQKRNKCQNCCLLLLPLISVILLGTLERYMHSLFKTDDNKKDASKLPNPITWPPVIQIPISDNRAVKTKFMPYFDVPPLSCRNSGDCPVTFLLTGTNQSLTMNVAENLFPTVSPQKSSNFANNIVIGTDRNASQTYFNYIDPSFPLYYLQSNCTGNSTIPYPSAEAALFEVACLEGLHLWRNTSAEINVELYKGSKANKKQVPNEFPAAFDFLNSNRSNFNVNVWANPSDEEPSLTKAIFTVSRLPRLINMVSKAFIQHLKGPNTQMVFEFVQEVPLAEMINPQESMFATFVDILLRIVCVALPLYPFTIILTTVVYEKEKNLRIMMKMHGLRDTAYWAISYAYSLLVSVLYLSLFVIGGKFAGLAIFTKNDLSLQLLFYFLHMNWQIAFAFVVAAFVSRVRVAQVFGTLLQVLVTFLGFLFFSKVIDADYVPKNMAVVIELFPGFALYRGAYEFQKYATFARDGAEVGMKWQDLNDPTNGLKTAMMIMAIEWLIMLFLAFYLDQVIPSGMGKTKSPFFFLKTSKKESFPSHMQGIQAIGSFKDNTDVAQERQKVEQLVKESSKDYVAICQNIKKIHPGRDGNPPKAAVRGLSLALPTSECFGMLGPNGAGKTSFISMMIGLTEPTSGTAYIEGLDITTQMDEVYTCMGVCPQFDLLWETLSAREHLYFYGRLKNLTGSELTQAVDESLKSVNLFNGGVADKHSGKYSGGMKRRLSVAISLNGDPKIVYLDEPSTGLDPASRNQLWSLVKRAKQNRAILLTTHSMEEAEALCDRLGVFVDGALRCVGNSKELKARYGGYFLFTMTTTSDHDAEVEDMVLNICHGAQKTYHLGGTQKFELPKHEVRLAKIFELVETAKKRFPVQAWAIADTTLEDVFIKVTRQAQAKSSDDHS